MCEFVDQYALCYVVSSFLFSCNLVLRFSSHASIDPKLRAERGLPEDLIRLCIGIEDAGDLLDDLEHSLLEAGAIAHATTGPERYVRVQPGVKQDDSISRAVERLSGGIRPKEHREWFVSAPGKVILFGEHAVVHGVVSACFSVYICLGNLFVTDCCGGFCGFTMLCSDDPSP